MKEYFVVTDTHSFYDEMMTALKKKGFDENNPEHILIHCGDLLDRGPKSKAIVDFCYELLKQKRFIFVLGNHEELFQDMVHRGEYWEHDIHNGTVKSLGQLQEVPLNMYETMMDFDACCLNYDKKLDDLIASAVDYYETPKHIFVHGWIPVIEKERGKYLYDPNWRNASKSEWIEARWTNGVNAAKQGVIEPGKKIVCGHWHCSYGWVRDMLKKETDKTKKEQIAKLEYSGENLKIFKPYKCKGAIAIDACTALTGFCNCLHYTEEEI